MSGPETCDVCDRFIEEDDGMVVAHEDCLDPDDARDGRALRLLRAALDVDDFLIVYGPNRRRRSWEVETDNAAGEGSTLAEAADACRAALEARS